MLIKCKERQIVLPGLIEYNEVRYSNLLNALCDNHRLIFDNSLPRNRKWNIRDFEQQINNRFLFFNFEKRDQFRQNEIIDADQIVRNKMVQLG